VESRGLIVEKYLRREMLPTIFCAGCGVGSIMNYVLRAIERLSLNINKTIFVSGIGCSSRIPGYIHADGLHTTHGRAIAFATGIKICNPELNVIVFTGDGDCVGIGGNHFIHGIRRNIDITVIAVNNFTYGMTGGQLAPTTPRGSYTTTTPYGNIEHAFDMAHLAKVAGAPYVARWSVLDPHQSIKSIGEGIRKHGFAFIEMLSPCPTAFGRRNELKMVRDQWEWYKNNTIHIKKLEVLRATSEEVEIKEAEKKIIVGVLQDIEKPEYVSEWNKLLERVACTDR
jgi:2-oxoglutarate ferredoxin oxidoreductase subunit beta